MDKPKRIKKTPNNDIYMRYISNWCYSTLPNACRELVNEARDKKSYKEELIDKLFDVCRSIAVNLNRIKEEDGANN